MPDAVIFDSPTVRVKTLGDALEGPLVVSFQNRSPKQALDMPGFGQEFFTRYSIAALIVTVSRNHWYQTDDTLRALDAIRGYAAGRSICTYGSSMGAYAAINFSRDLDAKRVIALSPLAKVNPKAPPFETRWRHDISSYPHDDRTVSPEADVFLFYDPLLPDGRHAETVAGRSTRTRLYPMPFSGHPCGKFMTECGMLSKTIRALIANEEVSPIDFRQEVRRRRRDSAFYWRTLAETSLARRPHLSLHAAERAVEISSDGQREISGANMKPRCLLGLAMCRTGNVSEGLTLLREAVQFRPEVVQNHASLARGFYFAKNRKGALSAIERAIELAPGAHTLERLREKIRAMPPGR
jgi:hypothetical protein